MFNIPKEQKEQNLRKVVEWHYSFLTRAEEVKKYVEMMQSSYSYNCLYHFNIKILNLFDPELQLINTERIIKNKLKELLTDLKKFKVQK